MSAVKGEGMLGPAICSLMLASRAAAVDCCEDGGAVEMGSIVVVEGGMVFVVKSGLTEVLALQLQNYGLGIGETI